MIRNLCFALFAVLAIGIQPVFARPQNEAPSQAFSATGEWEVPFDLLNNEFLLESQRLVQLAEEAYLKADYDTAAYLANEAIYYAHLSDDFITQQMGNVINNVPLPASYTVQTWDGFKDCFWNIAARPWAYGDPHQWRVLYNANRLKLPEPDNPNLLEPGIILEIPSLRGEIREGAWEADRSYNLLR